MPIPQTLDLTHCRGDTLALAVALWEDEELTEPSDLTEAVVAAQVRTTADASTVVANFATSIEGNSVSLLLSPSQTATLPPKGVWDLQIDWLGDGNNVQTPVGGSLTITPDVTRTP